MRVDPVLWESVRGVDSDRGLLAAVDFLDTLVFRLEENISFTMITMRSLYKLLLSMCVVTIDYVVDRRQDHKNSTPSLPSSEAEALPAAVAL